MIWLTIPIGFLLDLIIGDPEGFPHPVVMMGKLINFLDKRLRSTGDDAKREKLAGGIIWIVTVTVSTAVPAVLLFVLGKTNFWLRFLVEAFMCYQILATKSLGDAAMNVYKPLASKDISLAREKVSMIVGRETEKLDEKGITRATVETVAENTSDGVIAPLFFMAIGGATLGFMYKAVNTMDSMLGYTDEPYKNVGFIPAKMDDVFNYIPARLSAGLMLVAGMISKLDVQSGIRIFKRDRYNHASPNSAQTESVMAGLLNVRLGGDAYYHGVLHKKPYIGDDIREIEKQDIVTSRRILYMTAALGVIVSVVLRLIILKIVG